MAQRVPSPRVRNETISHDDNSGSATGEQENAYERCGRGHAHVLRYGPRSWRHESADGLAPKGRHERIASDETANDLPKMLWPHGVRVHTRSSRWRGELAGEMGRRPTDGEFLAWRPREPARAGTGAGDHVSMRRLRLSGVVRNATIAPAHPAPSLASEFDASYGEMSRRSGDLSAVARSAEVETACRIFSPKLVTHLRLHVRASPGVSRG